MFRFHQIAIQTVRSRYIATEKAKYKIIPAMIAVDVDKEDANDFVKKGLGELVTGRPANGSPAYQSLKP